MSKNTFKLLSDESQFMGALCTLLVDKISKTDLVNIVKYTKDLKITGLFAKIKTATYNECEKANILRYRYAAIESSCRDSQDIFWAAIKLPYFKALCRGYVDFINKNYSYWSWGRNDTYEQLALRLAFYVFDAAEIESDSILKLFINRYKMPQNWRSKEALRRYLFLYEANMEEINRINNPTIRMELLEDVNAYYLSVGTIPTDTLDYLLDRLHQIHGDITLQKLPLVLMYNGNEAALKTIAKDAPQDFLKAWAQGYLHFMNREFKKAAVFLLMGDEAWNKVEEGTKTEFKISSLFAALCYMQIKAPDEAWSKFWKLYNAKTINQSSAVKIIQMLLGKTGLKDIEEIQNSDISVLMSEVLICDCPPYFYLLYWAYRQDILNDLLRYDHVKSMAVANPWLNKEIKILETLLSGELLSEKLETEAVFHQIYQPKPEWELLLEQVQQILDMANPNSSTQQEERVAWVVSFQKFTIDARLQKIAKNGNWTKGRAMGWQKLIMESEYDYILSAQDRKIIQAFAPIYNKMNDYYRPNPDKSEWVGVFEALATHPYIFLAESTETPVQLVPGKLELQITKTQNGYVFENPYQEHTIGNVFVLKRETPTRYLFIRLSSEQKRVLEILNKKSLSIPLKGEETLRRTAQKISAVIPVNSELIVDENIPEHEYDPRIYVHILPLGDMFQVELYVKPFGEEPPYFPPGIGLARVVTNLHGDLTFVQRNLSQEKSDAEALVAYSQVLDIDNHTEGVWTLDGIEPCLRLLSELNELRKENKAVLEWPQGEKLKISSYASFDHLFMRVFSTGEWFEMEGELRVSENSVMDMKTLLELSRQSNDRFLTLDDGSYLALTEQLYKRLKALDNLAYNKKDKLNFSRFAGAALHDMAEELKN